MKNHRYFAFVTSTFLGLQMTAAFADQMIASDKIVGIASDLLNSDCADACTADGLTYRRVQLPSDLGIGERRAFFVWDAYLCGSGGCPTAAVAIGSDGVYYLGDGLGLSEQSPYIRPVSDQNRIKQSETHTATGTLPVTPLGVSLLKISEGGAFFDPNYNEDSGQTPAQHIGIDLPASVRTPVVSPVNGVVLANHTDLDSNFAKFLILVDSETGDQHVLGHIVSALQPGTQLKTGDPIGTIVSAGTGPHVHWGINSRSVPVSPVDNWGWGRAPISATKQEAVGNGWIDPEVWFQERTSLALPDQDASVQNTGPLCAHARGALEDDDLKRFFWGAAVYGTTKKGSTWNEYLGRGFQTIISGSSGRKTIGVYKIDGSEICFSYGTEARWSCKAFRRCISGEGPYVITNLDGEQTSLITKAEMYGAAPIHAQWWSTLSQTQELSVPETSQKIVPSRFSELAPGDPRNVISTGRIGRDKALIDSFAPYSSGSNFKGGVDLRKCVLTLLSEGRINKTGGFAETGGWASWMGTPGATPTIGTHYIRSEVPLGKIDTAQSAPIRGGFRIVSEITSPIFVRNFQQLDGDTLQAGNVEQRRYLDWPLASNYDANAFRHLLFEANGVCGGKENLKFEDCAGIADQATRLSCFDSVTSQ